MLMVSPAWVERAERAERAVGPVAAWEYLVALLVAPDIVVPVVLVVVLAVPDIPHIPYIPDIAFPGIPYIVPLDYINEKN